MAEEEAAAAAATPAVSDGAIATSHTSDKASTAGRLEGRAGGEPMANLGGTWDRSGGRTRQRRHWRRKLAAKAAAAEKAAGAAGRIPAKATASSAGPAASGIAAAAAAPLASKAGSKAVGEAAPLQPPRERDSWHIDVPGEGVSRLFNFPACNERRF